MRRTVLAAALVVFAALLGGDDVGVSKSALFRTIVASDPVAYWPMSDRQATGKIAAAVGPDGKFTPGKATGTGAPILPGFATGPAGPGSEPVVNIGGFVGTRHLDSADTDTEFTLTGPAFSGWTNTDGWAVDHSFHIGTETYDHEAPISTAAVQFRIFPVDQTFRWSLALQVGGIANDGVRNFVLATFDSAGNITDSWNSDDLEIVESYHVRFAVVQSGGNVSPTVTVNGSVLGWDSSPAFAGTLTAFHHVRTGPSSKATVLPQLYFGHVAVWDTDDPALAAADAYDALLGYSGEQAHVRAERVCDEESVPIVIRGTTSPTMGPQPVGDLITVLRDCEMSGNAGILDEALTGEIRFSAISSRYNLAASVALDAAQGHIKQPFRPADDDQGLVNDSTASRPNGSFARAVNQTSIDAVGRYDERILVNAVSDDDLPDHASWRVHIGS